MTLEQSLEPNFRPPKPFDGLIKGKHAYQEANYPNTFKMHASLECICRSHKNAMNECTANNKECLLLQALRLSS